jgi:hypothetical protein
MQALVSQAGADRNLLPMRRFTKHLIKKRLTERPGIPNFLQEVAAN